MGSIISSIRDLYRTVRLLIDTLVQLNSDYAPVLQRINNDPGLPSEAPTTAYWTLDPPFPNLVDVKTAQLPKQADVLIIGSGITGAAIARTVLQECERKKEERTVVVLEARELTSGATARNGGHIKAVPYETFSSLKRKLGPHRAAEIVRFQMRHLDILINMCKEDGIDVAECRQVETVDIFLDPLAFGDAKGKVLALKEFLPEANIQIWEAAQARENFCLGDHVVGALSYEAGAVFPYRLVTAVWDSILQKYSSSIFIETSTPATLVNIGSSASHPFQVHTPRGIVHARHVVHATNAFASSLIPGLKGKMIGFRCHMSAQQPSQLFPKCDGRRSWSFIYGKTGFDYMSQRPTKDKQAGDLMLGGGFFRSAQQGLDQVGVWDDSITDAITECHLTGMISTVFQEQGRGGSLKNIWSGITCYTADCLPYVGKLDTRLTGRQIKDTSSSSPSHDQPAEWISAGYHGEGMVYAWLCGVAVALMITGSGNEILPERSGIPYGKMSDWFPKDLLVDYKRVKNGNILDIANEL